MNQYCFSWDSGVPQMPQTSPVSQSDKPDADGFHHIPYRHRSLDPLATPSPITRDQAKRQRLNSGFPTSSNYYEALQVQESSDEDYEDRGDETSGSEGSEEASSSEDSDEEELRMNVELTDILPRKTVPEPPSAASNGKKGKGKQRGRARQPARPSATAAGLAIAEASGRRKRKRKGATSGIDKENVSPPEIPGPSRIASERRMPGPTTSTIPSSGLGVENKAEKKPRNFIYQFFSEVDTNPTRAHSASASEH
ncbi:hypothetical protein L226DRAFT_169744 [Lentinus tigrinus ALCF2SS1-7]|uniref:uncharacterized protein n=1 Tax=Lentinus tigrinus ALCF2SS1-7 TaxID=1328758 RepID=UPI0011660A28|nr:hypothetical protein L226DRAFT_169744 [Lentinus tigrinus ALCF2SS1-7]